VTDELLVAGVVRTLAEHAFPHDPLLVDQAVSDAVKAYLSGASISEACRVGQLFITAHHPFANASVARRDQRIGELAGQGS
jgi:hypothetical protein